MKIISFILLSVVFLCVIVCHVDAYDYYWEIDETPQGQETATIVDPIIVTLYDTPVEVSSETAALQLSKRYNIFLDPDWSAVDAQELYLTFQSIPQTVISWHDYDTDYDQRGIEPSIWQISDQSIQNDFEVEYRNRQKVVTISKHAFTYAQPLLAEIEGVKGRYFSKRLHRAIVRYVTNNGTNEYAIRHVLKERYNVSIDIPDYTELTKHTTGEDAGRFSQFKSEELIALLSMFEEYPQGMLKTPGLKYLVRRLDGLPHPTHPTAPAVAWTSAGYIEFMESAFKEHSLDFIHRLILHEKAHFLWAYLFNDQLKNDWIELGGWYENPDDKDGWSTTQQTQFVSAYAHGKNPNEDMAESISFYIVRPDKLRSRAPEKYEFIQNRIMHGTRYISQIRQDLTFEVYNLYPDYVYPGRIVSIDIHVEGEPEDEKHITITIEIHTENELDTASHGFLRLWSEKGTREDVHLHPISNDGHRVSTSNILQAKFTLSRYAANGYWAPDTIRISDPQRNDRHESQSDYGWKLHIDNPLADCEPPQYVPNSMRMSLSNANENGKPYQIVTATWNLIEKNGIDGIYAQLNDATDETYSRRLTDWGEFKHIEGNLWVANAKLRVPDYYPSGSYKLVYIQMKDLAQNRGGLSFTESQNDELPATIEVETVNPDLEPPVLDLNNITIIAQPTNPDNPNGETRVDIEFRVKDNISGHRITYMNLRSPQGVMLNYDFYDSDFYKVYFTRDPTIYQTYHKTIILPAGSQPGIWGLANMTIYDKARNKLQVDFTEIVRFEVEDASAYAKADVNEDGEINILDLVLVASSNASNKRADVNGDGTVNILDLVVVASYFSKEEIAAPAANNPSAVQIQNWITQAIQADDGNPAFRRGIQALQNLLLNLHPKTTVLLPNFPNPFNPETWIPYQLAKSADVSISIYTANGKGVRTLQLGRLPAGEYKSRSRAAYWDGKNNTGEIVASGVYFYTLTAGDFSTTRKMLIRK